MATVTTLSNVLGRDVTNTRLMDNTKAPYVLFKEIDLAAAVTAKGSALAAADVLEVLRLPPQSVVTAAWAVKTAALTGTVSVLTINVGITGVGATDYGSAWDGFGAAVGGFSTPGAMTPRIITTSDTIDLTLASLTGTLTGGKIAIYATVVDATTKMRGVIAQPKS